jgi:acetolactate synthase-1/3 small subunit
MSPDQTTAPPSAAPSTGPAHAAPPARALPGSGPTRRHVIVAIVNNKPGVLNRVASLMRARSFNIESLAVSHTDDATISRMTITLRGDDVRSRRRRPYRSSTFSSRDHDRAERQHELAPQGPGNRREPNEVIKVVELYRGRWTDVADGSVIVESTGSRRRSMR